MVVFEDNASATSPDAARRLLFIAALVTGLLVSGAALAADGDGEDGKNIPGGPLGDQLEDYWSVDRDVDVIKERLYERSGRFGIGLLTGAMSSQPFYWYIPSGLRASYYFNNNWGIEVEGAYMGLYGVFQHPTALGDFAEKQGGYNRNTDALDQFNFQAHALAVWHPFYGKLSVLQRKLAHFDVNLAAGLGAVGVTRPNELRTESSDIVRPELVYGGGIQFFVNNNIVLRADARGYIYRGPRRYMNTQSNQRVVSQPRNPQNSEELNFFQELEFPFEFLFGATYMF